MSAGAAQLLPLNIARHRGRDEQNNDVGAVADRFCQRYVKESASENERKKEATALVNEYFDIVTDFYEYGWGQSFHFATSYLGESFYESLARHEYFLVYQGQFKPTDKVLDVGCGIGGPARNVVRFSSCSVTGVNNNEYQIKRARRHDTYYGFCDKINYVKSDFCNLCFGDNEFDGAYAIEATCHSADKNECYSEVFRVIKPGACFVLYEWCLTSKYDPANEEHRRVRHGIEFGNGLPSLDSTQAVLDAMAAAGFIVEDSFDITERFTKNEPKSLQWYAPLQGRLFSLFNFKSTPMGRWVTSKLCQIMEFLRFAPNGTRKTAEILEEASVNLVKGGELGIFTPSFFVKARKPST
ncbi:Mycolic acid cyclopropane synthetase ubiE COQ5 methyltransferase family Methyltransferase domain [Trypanosoma vivax]|uniref:Methyltransferase n=1 Tax=Trypanosoma vivax (strain Y486) TaxID=1055687 RepID=G0U6Y1_TRYVY|nr:Mycolic acid cyclopropane synthetase ubiE COQ5 methyltransferase family Methyltransferase domain [Trypanosoma vivax]CCC51638.1 putative sterol 24-c-methyltransferase [Trypanosoma vivax Y486]